MSEEVSTEQLKVLQRDHITFLESSQFDRFTIRGVPVVKCFNYKLIQIINNIGLKDILGEAGEDAKDTGQLPT